MKKTVLLLVISLIGIAFLNGQNSAEKILQTIKLLASPEFSGRSSGSTQQQKTVDFIVQQLKKAGLKPLFPKKSFVQEVPLDFYQLRSASIKISAEGRVKEFYLHANFEVAANSLPAEGESEIIFIQTADLHRISQDISGKLILVSLNNLNRKNVEKIIRQAYLKRAGGVLFFFSKQTYTRLVRPSYLGSENFLIARVDSSMIDQLFWSEIKKIDYYQKNPLKADTVLHLKSTLKWNIDATLIKKAKSYNICGYIEGKSRKNEYLMVGAHWDHLGADAAGHFPGADDNASGVATVLEMAHFWSKMRPQRSIIFSFWCGEEIGLIGSEYFVKNSPLKLEEIVFYLNLDMVGQGNGIYLMGKYYGGEIQELLQKELQNEKDVRFMRGGPGGSDHTSFLLKGIPAYFVYTSGDHFNYHTYWDLPELINTELTARVFEILNRAIRTIDQSSQSFAFKNREENFLLKYLDLGIIQPLSMEELRQKNLFNSRHIDYMLLKSSIDPQSPWQSAAAELEKIYQIPAAMINTVSDLKSNIRAEKKNIFWGIDYSAEILQDTRLMDFLKKNGLRFVSLNALQHDFQPDLTEKIKANIKGLFFVVENISPQQISVLNKVTFPTVVRINRNLPKPDALKLLKNTNLFLLFSDQTENYQLFKNRSLRWQQLGLAICSDKNSDSAVLEMIINLNRLKISRKRLQGYLANNLLEFLARAFNEEIMLRRPF